MRGYGHLPRLIWLTLLALMLTTLAVAADPQQAEGGEELSVLVATAIASNPEVKAAEARWQSFLSRISQVSSLDDPMLMLRISNALIRDPLNFKRDAMTQKVIGISQLFPFWGKLSLREELAGKEAEFYRWNIAERQLALARMVKESWYQLYFIDRSLEVLQRSLKLLDNLVTSAETRYAVGRGAQQDIYMAQLERSMLLETTTNLHQQRQSLQTAINALLYRPAETPVGAIPDFNLTKVTLPAEELLRLADEVRPALQALRANIAKGNVQRQLAQKEYFPDLTASFEYMQREPAMGGEGDDMYSAGVTFNLPLQNKRRRGMAAEAAAETSMAHYELESLRNSIRSGVSDALLQLQRAEKLVELYKTGILPQARQSLESAQINYQVGKVEFAGVLESWTRLYNYERSYHGMLAEHQMIVARLEALVGQELTSAAQP